MIELYENLTIENDLGTFEGFNHKTQEALDSNVTAQELLDWDHDGLGEAEFWHSGDNPGVALILDSNDVLPKDVVALDRLLSELGDDASVLARIYFLTEYSGHRLQELDPETVEDAQLSVFIDNTSMVDLRRTAAHELFELYYPEAFRAWEQSSCDGLIFDVDRFLDSPVFCTIDFKIGDENVLIVEPL
jgi:hypothetical protein